MLDINRLRVLLRVIETGSVTAAADDLFHTPSAVSQQLRKLEAEVGQPLVHRRTDGMIPTDAGLVLAGHARTILRQMDAAESDLRRLARLEGGSLSVGTFPTIGSSFLPLVIGRFRRENPSVALDVRSSRLEDLVDLLSRGEVGLCFLWEYAWNPLDPRQFDLTLVFEEPTVLLVGAEHPLAGRESVQMSELASEPWIIRADDHPVAELLQRSCLAAGFSPRIAFQANDYLEAQAMASVGLGVALAPESAVVTRHPGVRVLALGDDAPSRRILLAQRHDRVRAPAEVAFQSLVLQLGESWRAGRAEAIGR
ncbi:LysR family transcriptional regulator [Microbacterium sp. KNMS]